jgi:membrane-bound ClpP family serine protease
MVVFFILNQPVNVAFASWTTATLPSDWQSYRLRWETGHAISFVLVLVAFIALLRALFQGTYKK